jgi:hypothetical protein
MNRILANLVFRFQTFLQLRDYYFYEKRVKGRKADDSVLFAPLLEIMRPDVIYIAVSIANYGLRMFKFRFPNVLVLSAGGEGVILLIVSWALKDLKSLTSFFDL